MERVEIIKSQRGHDKIVVHGYLLVKDKNRNDTFYWSCEQKQTLNCKGRATTNLIGADHFLKGFSQHCHAPEASRALIAKISHEMKEVARQTNDQPIQIVQNAIARAPQSIRSCLPSKTALRQQVKKVRRENFPAEPNSLENFVLPLEYQMTLNGENFCRDIRMDNDRTLIFLTNANLIHLRNASFWIMDGTFKTVPTIFKQLYTIHAPVGGPLNSRILPLVYALMSSKSEESYSRLFQELNDIADQRNIELRPDFVLTDFEKAAMNAVRNEFHGVQNKCCNFHLAQSVYRRIQTANLQTRYGTDQEFSKMMRHIPALAFLSDAEIPDAFDELKPLIPNEAQEIVKWFEETYVHGRVRVNIRNGNIIRHTPLFPPNEWSVFENVEFGFPRTQNKVEAWHRRWETLVGRAHVGLFRIINEIKKEDIEVETEIERIISGEPAPKMRKKDEDRENRLQTIIRSRNTRTTMQFVRGIANNLVL
jgi:hypothetical protein